MVNELLACNVRALNGPVCGPSGFPLKVCLLARCCCCCLLLVPRLPLLVRSEVNRGRTGRVCGDWLVKRPGKVWDRAERIWRREGLRVLG